MATSMDRPSDNAQHPELALARQALAEGDLPAVRRHSQAALTADSNEDDRQQAARLLAATRSDPASVYLLLGCLAFFLLVVYAYVIR